MKKAALMIAFLHFGANAQFESVSSKTNTNVFADAKGDYVMIYNDRVGIAFKRKWRNYYETCSNELEDILTCI
ncbi:MAG: hypothetical protein IPM82_12195 [Saprospiraceae bacterium]|nr:hypothetical protein [Saprospiraceae bacterium]